MRVINVSMEQHQNERAGETGNPRENPPTNGIVWQFDWTIRLVKNFRKGEVGAKTECEWKDSAEIMTMFHATPDAAGNVASHPRLHRACTVEPALRNSFHKGKKVVSVRRKSNWP
ncbi:hypothetical protein PR048_006382 [Dryococelus australis]|uniref:Uncharacterized protein n=1 Tax=Dryococelus australis TaxID=614101 RepID=A0ABQ9IBU8_9NEOP|nr:hypothetical protein PR048_006382 [Dryococelus australis]